jgi:hypothetical protein
LNQPLSPKSKDEAIDYSVDTKLLLQVLALLGDMLNKSDTNQEEMLRCHGFAVIGYLVQRASPQHLTSDTLVTIEDLGNKIQIPELLEKFYTDFMFNWQLWVYANATVQWELTVLLCTLTKNNAEACAMSINQPVSDKYNAHVCTNTMNACGCVVFPRALWSTKAIGCAVLLVLVRADGERNPRSGAAISSCHQGTVALRHSCGGRLGCAYQ